MTLPYPFIESYLMFFIYSFVGWVIEVIYYGITEGKFINRGFLAGPLCPVYGLGFYAAIWIFEPFKDNFLILFFGMATACTIVELIAGFILYHAFHMRWWDYSDYKLNLGGYICLRFFIYWGIAASLGMYVLHPTVKWLIAHINYPVRIGILIFFTIILLADLITTIITIIGFKKKFAAMEKVVTGTRAVSDKIGSQISLPKSRKKASSAQRSLLQMPWVPWLHRSEKTSSVLYVLSGSDLLMPVLPS